jgi:RND superfamily putative drug exporter
LIGWIAAAVIVTLLAPNLNNVTSNNQSDFLPKDASSRIAEKLVVQYFPQEAQNGTLVLVFDAGAGAQITDPARWAFVDDVSRWLAGPDKPAHVLSVLSPTLNPEEASNLIAADGQIAMAVVTVDTGDADQRAVLLDAIGQRLEATPTGVKAYRTSEVAIGHEYNQIISDSVSRTICVTLILVVLILLAIYRLPVSPLIPLFVVTIAFMIARGIVSMLAKYVFTVSDTAVMLLIVVMYGAGTDYCLFLISRFREEMADHDDSRASVRSTVRHVGESISSSAGTVMTGFVAMGLAKLGLFNTTGPTLAVGVVVSLLAGLTLTPAILGLLGRWTFWPSRARRRNAGALYKRTSQWVSSRPLLTILLIVTVMVPLAYYEGRTNYEEWRVND